MPRSRKNKFKSHKYNHICKCCNKCNKTFYMKGNNQKSLERQVNMKLRLHHKKCKGKKNLTDKEIQDICDNESDIYNAPFKTLSKLTDVWEYETKAPDNEASYRMEDLLKFIQNNKKE